MKVHWWVHFVKGMCFMYYDNYPQKLLTCFFIVFPFIQMATDKIQTLSLHNINYTIQTCLKLLTGTLSCNPNKTNNINYPCLGLRLVKQLSLLWIWIYRSLVKLHARGHILVRFCAQFENMCLTLSLVGQ